MNSFVNFLTFDLGVYAGALLRIWLQTEISAGGKVAEMENLKCI